MKKLWVLFFVWSLFIWGCSNSTTNEDLATFKAIFEAKILDNGGDPVRGADVQIVSYAVDCNDKQGDGISHGVEKTNSEGEIKRKLLKLVQENIRCIMLNIRPDENSGLQDTTTTITTDLELKYSPPFERESLDFTY